MIKSSTHHPDWIFEVKKKLGNRYDPKLIEKVIYALIFLEQLKINKLNFIFKGGTALLLATEKPKRFSIDIDIITEQRKSDIEKILEIISKGTVFTHWEDDNDRKHTPDAPIGHFKMYYKSNVDGNVEPILLDVLYTPNPYPELKEIPIAHDWIQTDSKNTIVNMPTFDAILGDKLTAFAPKTTGILYSKLRPVEIIKQLFDVAFLMDNISDLDVVRDSYAKVVAEEISFRKLEVTVEQVLVDTQQACFVLSTRDIKSDEFKHLQTGISNFTNFTIERFNIEEAIIAAAKVTYLAEILKYSKPDTIEKFGEAKEVKDWYIEPTPYNRLNKLKKSNPEAFFYWYKAVEAFSQKQPIFSNLDRKALQEAIKYYRARKGSYSSNDPLLDIKTKIENESLFVSYLLDEMSLLLKVINENTTFLDNYKYEGLDRETAFTNKQNILEPLFQVRKLIKEKLSV